MILHKRIDMTVRLHRSHEKAKDEKFY